MLRHNATLLSAIFLTFALFTPCAHAGDIQMLPPSAQSSTPTLVHPCTGLVAGSPSVLAWDGANPINCITGFYADPNGNIGIGTSNPTAALDVIAQPDKWYFGGIVVHGDQRLGGAGPSSPGILFSLSADPFDLAGGIGVAAAPGGFADSASR